MDNQHNYLKNIIDGLKNDNPEIRKKAILLIARMDNPKLIKLITPLINDENDDVKLYAQKVYAILSKKYSQKEQLVEESAKESAKEELIKSNSFLSKLIELLSNSDFKVRIAALEQVNGQMPLEVLNQIKSHLIIEQNEYVIATCIKSIGKFGKIEDIAFLKKYLLHTDPRIKSNTVEALISIGQTSDILRELLPLVNDKDDRIKVTVIQYFGRLSRSELLESLIKIAYEGNEIINTFVIKLSFLLNIDDSLKLYKKIFSILSNDLKQLVVDYLKSSSDLNALDFIDQLSNDTSSERKFNEKIIDEESKNIINVEELINDSPIEFSNKIKQSKFNFAFSYKNKFFLLIILLIFFYAIYSSLYSEQYLYLAVDKNGKFIFINDSGKIILNAPFDDVAPFSENYAGIKIGNKWGFINRKGKIIINPQFDLVLPFTQQRALVIIDKKMGFIDLEGKFIINPQFDDAASFSEGLAAVKTNNKWGFIDLEGNYAINPQFDFAFPFCEGLTLVIIEKKAGYADKNGKLVIAPQFENATVFKEGLAAVKIGNKWGYINTTGNIVINPQFIQCGLFNSGLAPVMIGSDKTCVGFIDTKGKIIINPIYEYYKPHFIFEEINIDTLNLLTSTILLKLNYNNFNGMIPVLKNGKFGFIDKTGSFIIKPIFTNFNGVANDSLALVESGSSQGYIDKTGKFIYKFNNFKHLKSKKTSCNANMKTIEGAVELYQMENGTQRNLTPANLQSNGYLKTEPKCPYDNGDYKISIGTGPGAMTDVFCTIHGWLSKQSVPDKNNGLENITNEN